MHHPLFPIRTCLQRHEEPFISFLYPISYALLGSQGNAITTIIVRGNGGGGGGGDALSLGLTSAIMRSVQIIGLHAQAFLIGRLFFL